MAVLLFLLSRCGDGGNSPNRDSVNNSSTSGKRVGGPCEDCDLLYVAEAVEQPRAIHCRELKPPGNETSKLTQRF